MDPKLLKSLIEGANAAHAKRYKDFNGDGACLADDAPPLDGIVVDNPLLEKLLDQRILPFGRCFLIYGRKGNGKTTLFLELCKIFQQNGGLATWLETEQAADIKYAGRLGVNTNELILDQDLYSLEQALEKCLTWVKQMENCGDVPMLLGMDSLAMVASEYELEDKIGLSDSRPGGTHAKACAAFYRKLVHILPRYKLSFFMLNQLRDEIGNTMPGRPPGEAMPGGQAPRFNSSYQFKCEKVSDIKRNDEWGAERKVGAQIKITATRNKLGREGKTQNIIADTYEYGGFDWYTSLVNDLKINKYSFIEQRGAYVRWTGPEFEFPTFSKYNAKGAVVEHQGGVLAADMNLTGPDLGLVIKHCEGAKDFIRNAYGVAPMPSKKELEKVDEARKTKRKKKLSEAEIEAEIAAKGLDL